MSAVDPYEAVEWRKIAETSPWDFHARIQIALRLIYEHLDLDNPNVFAVVRALESWDQDKYDEDWGPWSR